MLIGLAPFIGVSFPMSKIQHNMAANQLRFQFILEIWKHMHYHNKKDHLKWKFPLLSLAITYIKHGYISQVRKKIWLTALRCISVKLLIWNWWKINREIKKRGRIQDATQSLYNIYFCDIFLLSFLSLYWFWVILWCSV